MLPYENLYLQTLEGEIWKPVVGYEGFYEVSNLGRIKSLERTFICGREYARKVTYHECIIKQYKNVHGYLIIGASNGVDKIKQCKVHRLVGEAFLPNPENMPIINHINSVKDDNRVENLEWTTSKGNRIHAIKYGNVTFKTGSEHPQSKTVYQYNLNGELVGEYDSIASAAKSTGYSSSHIGKNCNRIYDFYKDYVFSYEPTPKEYFNRTFEKRIRREKELIKYDLDGKEICRYKSPIYAAESIGGSRSNIHYAALGRFKTAYGYRWAYAE
jgi:hypothetical protein